MWFRKDFLLRDFASPENRSIDLRPGGAGTVAHNIDSTRLDAKTILQPRSPKLSLATWNHLIGYPVGIARMIETMSETGSDDLELARSGDAAAFMRLVQPYDRELRSFAYRMLGDHHAMDDVLQDVYLSAFRAIGRFRGDASPRTWL